MCYCFCQLPGGTINWHHFETKIFHLRVLGDARKFGLQIHVKSVTEKTQFFLLFITSTKVKTGHFSCHSFCMMGLSFTLILRSTPKNGVLFWIACWVGPSLFFCLHRHDSSQKGCLLSPRFTVPGEDCLGCSFASRGPPCILFLSLCSSSSPRY